MQVHEHAGAAPALAALTHDRGGKRMRFDALTHAELKNGKNLENGIKKPAYMVPVCGCVNRMTTYSHFPALHSKNHQTAPV